MDGMAEAVSAALTDGMIERLASTAATGLEIVDRLNDPDTRAAVHRLIDGLTSMHRTGALDTMFEAAEVMQAARSALTDDMVERLYHFIEVMVNNMATREIAELARDAELSLYEATRYSDSPDAPKSMVALVRHLLKPESVRTISLLLAFGTALRKRAEISSASAGNGSPFGG
jgi:uncharacterized protein YjgD (DUF1641 family)